MARYFKFDWCTFMVHDSCISDVLDKLNMADYADDFLSVVFQRDREYHTMIVFNFSGITFELANDFLYLDNSKEIEKNIFNRVFPRFRVDISGSGLDFLRSCNFDVNSFIIDLLNHQNYRITRIDWAFDFVNTPEDYLNMMITELNELKSGGLINNETRLKNAYGGNNYSYTISDGNEKSVLYIGATRSEKMLRIYNKYMQFVQDGIIKKILPTFKDDPDIKNWTRCELQTRNKYATNFLKTVSSVGVFYDEAWKSICRNYTIIDDYNLQVLKGFEKLFSFAGEARIILNENYVYTPVLEQAKNSFEKNLTNLVFLYLRNGMEWVEERIHKRTEFVLFSDDPRAIRIRRAVAIRIVRDLKENNINLRDYCHAELLQGLAYGL